ncbi:MAG: ABC-F type ribosomal protection protein [Armatimonadetes bacterium]|nr:ABC-F type ribosomal protection protein [Armatimonadota bacterium]
MSLLKAINLRKSYGLFDVLIDASCEIAPGDRVGLIGANGCGKSTLLKIMAGRETPDGGHVHLPGNPLVGYLPQEAGFPVSLSLMSALCADLPDEPPPWEAEELLAGLNFPRERWDQPVRTLSGGEQTRLMLARLLLMQPDLLLLDEPTNHLDLGALEWLEKYLGRFRGALLVISHDRRFLDHTVNRILELDGRKLREFGGNYSFYAQQKEEERRRQEVEYRRQQEEIASLKAYIKRASSRARAIGQGPKRGRDHYGRVASKMAKQAKAAERRLDRIERVQKPWEPDTLNARFQPETRHGQWAARAESLSKCYGDRVLFRRVDLSIAYGERVAIIGPNGAGKTTLLRILLGEEPPDEGESHLGPGVKVGYLAQHQENLNPEHTLLEEALAERNASETEVRTLLACFLFRRDEVFKKVGALSSGERVRLALVRLLASGCNLMVLDEPTHHLDIDTRERMEEALEEYPGTLLLVSHDRLLLDRLAERLVIIEGGEVTQYPGNYTDYLHSGEDDERVERALMAIETGRESEGTT